VGKPGKMRPLRGPRHRWDNNILIGSSRNGMGHGWIDLARDRDRWLTVVIAV
jgi:hypothetical protein